MSKNYYKNLEMEDKDKILTRPQAAKFLQVSLSTIDRYIASRVIPHVKVAGRILFSKFRLHEWILSSEKVPEEWTSEQWSQALVEASEKQEQIERSKRMNELRILLSKIYKENEDQDFLDSLSRSEKVVREEVEISLFEEYLDLLNAEDKLREKELSRLKDMFAVKKKVG